MGEEVDQLIPKQILDAKSFIIFFLFFPYVIYFREWSAVAFVEKCTRK